MVCTDFDGIVNNLTLTLFVEKNTSIIRLRFYVKVFRFMNATYIY